MFCNRLFKHINTIIFVRQEREVLRDENEQVCEQLRFAREELIAADLKLENMRQKTIEVSKQAQESIALERRKRIDAEEDARIHTEVSF